MMLVPKELTRGDCLSLAPRLRDADLLDIKLNASDPLQALLAGLRSGEAYGVWDGEQLIGAGGWTLEGAVWTLWSDLTPSQSVALLRMAAPWARILAIRAKRPLHNVFLAGNTLTERWLRATGCVNILDGELIMWQHRAYIPFFLKPLEDLPRV